MLISQEACPWGVWGRTVSTTGKMFCGQSPWPPITATAGGSACMAATAFGKASPDKLVEDLPCEQAHRVVDRQRVVLEFKRVPGAPAAADALGVTRGAGRVVQWQAGTPLLRHWLTADPEIGQLGPHILRVRPQEKATAELAAGADAAVVDVPRAV